MKKSTVWRFNLPNGRLTATQKMILIQNLHDMTDMLDNDEIDDMFVFAPGGPDAQVTLSKEIE